ncbi:MAG: hypothetical protein AAFV33_27850, partial [Chloroflexota bacterium]
MRPSVTELFWQLETGQESMQEDAIEAIAALSYQLHAHSSNLIKQLKHNSPHVRRLTAHTLGIIPVVDSALNERVYGFAAQD